MIPFIYFSSPIAKPTLKPVAENIFPALITQTVLDFKFGLEIHLGYENG